MESANGIIAQSGRLYFRHIHLSDQDALFAIYSDKEAMKFRSNPPLEDPEEARIMIENTLDKIRQKTEYRFAIVEKKTNELIGTFLYKLMGPTACEVGYSIGRNHWRAGYGYEALVCMLGHLRELGFNAIIATTKKENIPSMNLLLKAGFRLNEARSSDQLHFFELSLG